MIELRPINLHWLVGEGGYDDGDFCAHSAVYLRIGDRIVSDENSGDWTVSATSYYLLKALSAGHDGTREPQLLPCCGMPLPADTSDSEPVLVGCPNGINWSITKKNGMILHSFRHGDVREVAHGEWQNAVYQFSREVRQFFTESNPKKFGGDFAQERGFNLLMRKWDRLIEENC